MRISDWSSDVCSSDLQVGAAIAKPAKLATPALYPELARLWASGSTQNLYRLALRVGLAAGAVASVLLFLVGFVDEFILGTVIGPDFIPAGPEIGRAHVCTPVTNAHLHSRLLLEQKNN